MHFLTLFSIGPRTKNNFVQYEFPRNAFFVKHPSVQCTYIRKKFCDISCYVVRLITPSLHVNGHIATLCQRTKNLSDNHNVMIYIFATKNRYITTMYWTWWTSRILLFIFCRQGIWWNVKMMITIVALTQSETDEMVAKGSLGCGDCLWDQVDKRFHGIYGEFWGKYGWQNLKLFSVQQGSWHVIV